MSETLYDRTPANLEAAFRRVVARPSWEILGVTRERRFIQDDLFPVNTTAVSCGSTACGIRAPSRKQAAILRALSSVPQITLAEAVRLIGSNLYYNTEKHVGAVLSNMVRRGMIERVKRGVFRRNW